MAGDRIIVLGTIPRQDFEIPAKVILKFDIGWSERASLSSGARNSGLSDIPGQYQDNIIEVNRCFRH